MIKISTCVDCKDGCYILFNPKYQSPNFLKKEGENSSDSLTLTVTHTLYFDWYFGLGRNFKKVPRQATKKVVQFGLLWNYILCEPGFSVLPTR